MSDSQAHVQRPWLRGPINRGEAEDILTLNGLLDGQFLIRQSTKKPDDYVLTLAFNHHIYHYLILRENGMYRCAEGPLFRTLDELVDYFRTHDDGVHAYLRHPCTVQALRKSSKSKGVMVDIDQDDSEVAGGHHDSNSEHKLTTSQLKGSIFDRLKCCTDLYDDCLRKTFNVQMMGSKEVFEGLQHVKQNITSIISKIASKKKRKPVILMVSGEGMKVLDSKKKIIVQCTGEDFMCCMSSSSNQKHFAAILSSSSVPGKLMFTVMAFKNHLGSVGAVEDVASAVTGFMERHSSLASEDKDIGPPPIAPAMARSSVEPGSESSVKQPSNPFPVTLTRSPEYCPPSTTPNVDQLKLSPTTARRKQPIPFDRPPAPLPPEARSPEKRSHENEMVRHKSLPEVVSQSVVSSSNSDKDKPQYINVTASPSESSQYVNVPVRSPGQRLGQRAQSEDLQARLVW
jgi:hypothetical protein